MPNPRYDPETALKRLEFVRALEDIMLKSSSSELVSFEEIAHLGKEFFIFARSLVDPEMLDSLSVNPTRIIGETNVSTDKTVAGTVDSQKFYDRVPKPIGDFTAEVLKQYCDQKYLELEQVRKLVISQDLKNLDLFRKSTHQESKRAREEQLRRVSRKNKSLSYLLRKSKQNWRKIDSNKGRR